MPKGSWKWTSGTRQDTGRERQAASATKEQFVPQTDKLMEEVVRRDNLFRALKRVQSNKGSPGVDGMKVEDLKGYLGRKWLDIKEQLLSASYVPQPVKRVDIPKPDGGMRKLGIPAVVDRLIGQATLQVLGPIFDRTFSDSSHGFRKGRSQHSAIAQMQKHIKAGFRWVVDFDIAKFFDTVNHDILMNRIARKIKDKRVLKLLRRFLQAGIMENGLVSSSKEGTPQGSPLSPLLSNIYLDELDKELERRNHRFVRYADDCNVYIRSQAAGERVMKSIVRFLEKKLKLKVNEKKSSTGRPWGRKFLGYSVTSQKDACLKPAKQSVKRAKKRIREETGKKARGQNIKKVIARLNVFLRGWIDYYRKAQVTKIFRELDMWIRRRLRKLLWRQWKRPKTRHRKLVGLGLKPEHAKKSAGNGRGPWWNAGAAHMHLAIPNKMLSDWKLLSLFQRHRLMST